MNMYSICPIFDAQEVKVPFSIPPPPPKIPLQGVYTYMYN